MDCNPDSKKTIKSRYKYRIISKSCRRPDFTNIDSYRIITSVILVKILNIITADICIDFQLNARIFTLYSIGI